MKKLTKKGIVLLLIAAMLLNMGLVPAYAEEATELLPPDEVGTVEEIVSEGVPAYYDGDVFVDEYGVVWYYDELLNDWYIVDELENRWYDADLGYTWRFDEEGRTWYYDDFFQSWYTLDEQGYAWHLDEYDNTCYLLDDQGYRWYYDELGTVWYFDEYGLICPIEPQEDDYRDEPGEDDYADEPYWDDSGEDDYADGSNWDDSDEDDYTDGTYWDDSGEDDYSDESYWDDFDEGDFTDGTYEDDFGEDDFIDETYGDESTEDDFTDETGEDEDFGDENDFADELEDEDIEFPEEVDDDSENEPEDEPEDEVEDEQGDETEDEQESDSEDESADESDEDTEEDSEEDSGEDAAEDDSDENSEDESEESSDDEDSDEDADAEDKSDEDSDEDKSDDEDKDADADDKSETYTVHFETNGGTELEDQTVTAGEKAEKPEDPEKEDFDFDGWYTDEELETDFDFDAPITEDVTVYAKWTEQEDLPFTDSVTVDGVVISVEAEAGAFPASAKLTAEKVVLSTAQESAVNGERAENQTVAVSYTFDIKILDKDGEELQPAEGKKVEVRFALAEVKNENLEASVYHHDGETGEVTALDVSEASIDGEAAISAETDGFSLYTVEFTYNNLEYVLQGDESVPLSEILTTLKLSGTVTDASSSAPELFSVEQSGDDWIVTAYEAFSSTQCLTVIMDEVQYQITVTDANPVARIGTTTYDTLKAAFDAAEASSDSQIEIELLQDCTYSFTMIGYGPSNTAITVTKAITLTGSGTVSLDSNRKQLWGFTIDGGSLTIMPTSGTEGIKFVEVTAWTAGENHNTGGFHIQNGGVLNIYDGVVVDWNYDRCGTRTAERYFYGPVDVLNGTFNMYGGAIQNIGSESNPCTNTGGFAVTVHSTGTFNMSGGNISSAVTSNDTSGAVYVAGTFHMSGGRIGDNICHGVYIYYASSYSGSVTIDGTAVIENNTNKTVGGNTIASQGAGIYNAGGTLVIGGNAEIRNNVSNGRGGGVYISKGTFTFNGGSIYNNRMNTSTNQGSDLYISSGTINSNLGDMGKPFHDSGKVTSQWYKETNANHGYIASNIINNTTSSVTKVTYFTTGAGYICGPSDKKSVSYQYTGDVPANAPALPAADFPTAGTSVTVAAAPELDGYTFSGWTPTAESNITVTDGKFTMPSNDVVFTGSWSVKANTVSYEYTGTVPDGAPAVPESSTPAKDTQVEVKAKPTMTGYTLSDWSTSDVTVTDGKFTMPDKDVKFTGSWTINSHKVKYSYTGETPDGAPTVPTEETKEYNTKDIKVADTPKFDGYTFSGWTPTTASNITVTDGKFTMPDNDVVFEGSWEEVSGFKFTVTSSITGNMGNKYKTFPYRIELDGLTAGSYSYTITKSDGTETGTLTVADGATKGTLENIRLRAGDQIVFDSLPANATYKVTLTDPEDYTVTGQINSEDPTEGEVVSGTLNAETTVSFTVNRDGDVPTGLEITYWPGLMLTSLLPAAVILLTLRRRRREEAAN